MSLVPKEILDAIEKFKVLPGVGERSAMRNILKLLKLSRDEIIEFSESISELNNLNTCGECGVYCDQESQSCHICTNDNRLESKVICVVESFNDYVAIENSGEYKGLYHILGGVLNPLLNVGPGDLSIEQLKNRILKHSIEKIVLAINPSLEGQATCSYLKEVLEGNCSVERIGFGVPMGGSLEFLDARTISTALNNSTQM